MTTSTHQVATRVEVTDPTGRHFVTSDPPLVVRMRYPDHAGWRVREVHGYDHPDGAGFVVVHRH